MTETYTDDKWNTFESSGRISDYLAYKGVGTKGVSDLKGECANADNNSRCSHLSERIGGK
ncbi:MAG: hypothetical protein ACI4KF_04225 [Huintestinicola sp.]